VCTAARATAGFPHDAVNAGSSPVAAAAVAAGATLAALAAAAAAVMPSQEHVPLCVFVTVKYSWHTQAQILSDAGADESADLVQPLQSVFRVCIIIVIFACVRRTNLRYRIV